MSKQELYQPTKKPAYQAGKSPEPIREPFQRASDNPLLKGRAPGVVVGFWGGPDGRGGYEAGGTQFVPVDDQEIDTQRPPFGYCTYRWNGETLEPLDPDSSKQG